MIWPLTFPSYIASTMKIYVSESTFVPLPYLWFYLHYHIFELMKYNFGLSCDVDKKFNKCVGKMESGLFISLFLHFKMTYTYNYSAVCVPEVFIYIASTFMYTWRSIIIRTEAEKSQVIYMYLVQHFGPRLSFISWEFTYDNLRYIAGTRPGTQPLKHREYNW